MGERSRDDVIRVVQGLWRKADDPATPEAEKEALIEKARELMAKWVIDEMVLEEASGMQEAVVLSDIRIMWADEEAAVADQRILLAHFIAVNNRCKCVIQSRAATVDVKTGQPVKAGTWLTVVGFRSDVDMTRDLYYNVGLDMLTSMYGEPTSHMKAREQRNYWANFCDGYAFRIDERLKEINRRVHEMADEQQGSGGSMALVLRSRELAVQDTFAEMFPNLKKQHVSKFDYDPNAQSRGMRAADGADLGQSRVGGGSRGAIES